MAELIARVRYAGGYREVSDGGSGDKRYFFYAADDVKDVDAVDSIGAAVLDQTAGPRTTYKVVAETMPAVIQCADAVTFPLRSGTATAAVVARQMNVTRNGAVTPGLTLETRALSDARRADVAIRRLTGGTLGGRAAGASPATSTELGVPTGPLREVSLSPWSWSGTMIAADSEAPVQPPIDFYGLVTRVILSITPTPYSGGTFTAAVTQNGSTIRSVTLGTSAAAASVLAGAFTVSPGDTIGAKLTAVNSTFAALSDDDKTPWRLTLGTVVAPSRAEARS